MSRRDCASRPPCFTPPTLPPPAWAQEELGASHRHLADQERRGVDGTAEGDPAGPRGGGGDRLEHRLKVGGDRELVRGGGELALFDQAAGGGGRGGAGDGGDAGGEAGDGGGGGGGGGLGEELLEGL